MTLVELGRDYSPAIAALAAAVNTVVLVLLIIKYRSDVRKQRLEYEKIGLENEKLKREISSLQQRETEPTLRVVKPTAEDLRRYVIEPLLQQQAELQKQHLQFLDGFQRSHRAFETRDAELLDSMQQIG